MSVTQLCTSVLSFLIGSSRGPHSFSISQFLLSLPLLQFIAQKKKQEVEEKRLKHKKIREDFVAMLEVRQS